MATELIDQDITEIIIAKKKRNNEIIEERKRDNEKLDKMLAVYESTENGNSHSVIKITEEKKDLVAGASGIKWSKRAVELLKSQNKMLQTSQMIDLMFTNLDEKYRKKYVVSLSGALGGLVERDRIKQLKIVGFKGDFWGLPEMFNGNKAKPEYEPKK